MAILQAQSCVLSCPSLTLTRPKHLTRISSFLSRSRLQAATRNLKCLRAERHAVLCRASGEEGQRDKKFDSNESTSDVRVENNRNLSAYSVIGGLATLGFAETVYLTYMKLTGGSITCPIGGGSCNDVLDSDYAVVFGVPLSAIGVIAYGTVAVLGLLGQNLKESKSIDIVRWTLLGSTGAMASASLYFMYILSTELEGASCAYCVTSAILSVSLLLLTLRVRGPFFSKLGTWVANRFSFQEARRVLGLQAAVTTAVIIALSSSYADITPALTRSSEIDLPPVEPQVTTTSDSAAIALAKHLQSVGAKMYGAFWCSHCYEQKQMFGREAVKYLEYVECYPEGYRRGVKIAQACSDANIDGFPTWIIKGKVLAGEQRLSDLAREAGFDGFESQK